MINSAHRGHIHAAHARPVSVCFGFGAFVLIYTEKQKIAFLRCIDLCKPSAQDCQMQVIGSVFGGAGKDGDFEWLVTEHHYEDALFVFNDNEAQYRAHRDRPKDLAGAGCAPGGGNAINRP